jgi:hypothetical protein
LAAGCGRETIVQTDTRQWETGNGKRKTGMGDGGAFKRREHVFTKRQL